MFIANYLHGIALCSNITNKIFRCRIRSSSEQLDLHFRKGRYRL